MSFSLSGYANHLHTVSQRQSSENILLQVIPKTVINMYYNNDFGTRIYSVGLAMWLVSASHVVTRWFVP